ncbi:MAG: SpoIVB peptidase S55 domain-containing protein [Thermovirgaceae bacterium]|nr:SpoIVB peptidase S55 domain-containing protein [Thermovirgaceae bacterium]
MRKILILFLFLILYLATAGVAFAAKFSVPGGIMPVEALREGMKGTAFTVVKGDAVVSFPVTILSVLPSPDSPRNLILIRASGPVIEKTGGIAAGMSGSPVFIDGKLIGAIGYGWNFSEHETGLVTPIEEMAEIWKWPDRVPVIIPLDLNLTDPVSGDAGLPENDQPDVLPDSGDTIKKELSAPLLGMGYSARSAKRIGEILGSPVVMLPGDIRGVAVPVEYDPVLKPGEAVSVLVAWGDVSLAAIGTLTAVSSDGLFLAFAHPFTSRGAVAFPLARAWIHEVIPSIEAPFKIGTPGSIIGIVTQDRPQAIGGRIGQFAPVMDVSLKFADVDSGEKSFKRFKTAYDPFLMTKVIPEMLIGLVDNVWGRTGEGSAKITLKIEGGGLADGWQRTNLFFSSTDIGKDLFSEFSDLVDAISLNPFYEIMPLGIHLDVEITSDPRVVLIEDVNLSKKIVPPGGSFDVEITLRPFRKEPVIQKLTLRAPDDSEGLCEVVVRGGGIEEPGQESIEQGWRTIRSLQELLGEFSAMETNDEVVAEIRTFRLLVEDDPAAMEEEEESQRKLLSQIKEEKIKEGSMKSYRSNYYVDGLLRRMIRVVPE